MSRYFRVLGNDEQTPAPVSDEPQVHSSNPDLPENYEVALDLSHHLGRIKKFCAIMVVTSPIVPIVSYFVDPFHFVFYQSLFMFMLQFYVAFYGYRCTKEDHFNRIEYYRKLIHSFYVFYIIALILNQVIAVMMTTSFNFRNCDQFVNNRVCLRRTGLMTTQLVVLLFSPGIDFSVWIFYRYLLTVLNDCKTELIRRRV